MGNETEAVRFSVMVLNDRKKESIEERTTGTIRTGRS
jgi:hypothetical protein